MSGATVVATPRKLMYRGISPSRRHPVHSLGCTDKRFCFRSPPALRPSSTARPPPPFTSLPFAGSLCTGNVRLRVTPEAPVAIDERRSVIGESSSGNADTGRS